METIKKLLHAMNDEFDKNFDPPENYTEMTEEQVHHFDTDFLCAEAFKLGLKLGAEIFGPSTCRSNS